MMNKLLGAAAMLVSLGLLGLALLRLGTVCVDLAEVPVYEAPVIGYVNDEPMHGVPEQVGTRKLCRKWGRP